MKTLYLSHTLNNHTPTYGDAGKFEFQRVRAIEKGDTSNESYLNISNHLGTHIDAPYHFDNNGLSLDEYPADYWICNKPYLMNFNTNLTDPIGLGILLPYLEAIPFDTDLVLLKTGFEIHRTNKEIYCFKNPSVLPEVGIWLRKHRKLKFWGMDYISISSRMNREIGRETHKAFLSNSSESSGDPILLIEDMHLDELVISPSRVTVGPILFEKADGAPAIVIAEIF
jgi:kynurenine formamidase